MTTIYCRDCNETGEANEGDLLDPRTMDEGTTLSCGDCGSDNVTETDQLIDEAEPVSLTDNKEDTPNA